jgi:hypothetical protein
VLCNYGRSQRLANGIKDLVARRKTVAGTNTNPYLEIGPRINYRPSAPQLCAMVRDCRSGAFQRVAHSMEALAPKFVVQELAEWASASSVTVHRPTGSMEALDKSGMSDGAKMEEDAILEKITVWKSYYLLKMLPLT